VVAFVEDEDLGLVLQATEGRRMDDAVSVALELAPRRRERLRKEATARARWIRGIGSAPSLAQGPHRRSPVLRGLWRVPTFGHKASQVGKAPMSDIILTDRAALRIKEIMAGETPGTMLRISVNGGGCSGFSYAFDVEKTRQEEDLAVERDGATVVIDPVSIQYMGGSTIDFVDDLIGQSFKIENPQATASCGCGTSFSL
jgi:iron-sulfur cluster assembly accessory protein